MTKTLIDYAQPQEEVLHSTLDESVFAANLADALDGNAPSVYSDPSEFFHRTFPSSGLVDLLRIALGRLSGTLPDEPPVLRVDTNLGGGKTHNLIALCHACKGGIPAGKEEAFLGQQWQRLLQATDKVRLGLFVGTDWGVSRTDKTVWGHLAYQIGGDMGYALLRPDDETRTAPGADNLKKLLGAAPNLIVIDEIAHYLEKAMGVQVGESTLARQTLAFIMSLCEAAAQLANTVVVITTTQDSQLFGESTAEVLQILSRLMEITGRQARLIQPSMESDIPRLLTSRLFAEVDTSGVHEIARAYSNAVRAAEPIIDGLPMELHPQRMERRMEETWPYHPELIALLDKRLSTNPHFQRTRGALRLLARAVRLIWDDPERPLAIHPHHLDLSDDEVIRPQLTRALQRPAMDNVARADVANRYEPARAELIDGDRGQNYAKRAGTVCFLESLTQTASNPTQGSILGSALQPKDDANRMLAAWERLCAEAWYLHEERGGYCFKTEPSLTKMLQDQMDLVLRTQVLAAALALLEEMFSTQKVQTSGGVFKAYQMYNNEKAPDSKEDVGLCLFNWTQFSGQQGVRDANEPPAEIYNTWTHTDTGGLRQFRNRLVFVAPNALYFRAMEDAIRKRLALDELVSNETLTANLSDAAQTNLVLQHKEQQLNARVAVANVMNLIWYPKNNDELGLIQMQVDSTARAKRNQIDAVYEELDKLKKWLAAGDVDMDPAVLRQQLGQRIQSGCTVEEIEAFMAQNGECRILLDKRQLLTLIRNGVKHELWDYRRASDNQWITHEQGHSTDITALSSDAIHVKGSAPKPTRKESQNGSEAELNNADIPKPIQEEFEEYGSPGSALIAVLQNAQTARRTTATQLSITWNAQDRAALLCLARTYQVVAKVRFWQGVSIDLTMKLATQIADQETTLQFSGAEALAQPLEEPAKNILRQGRGSDFEATIALHFQSPIALDGDWQNQLHDVVQGTNVSACTMKLIAPTA